MSEGNSLIDVWADTWSTNQAYVPAVDVSVGLSNQNTGLGSADAYDGNLPTDWQNSDPAASDSVSASVTASLTALDIYDLQVFFGECYDQNGNYGIDPQGGSDMDCVWNDPTGPEEDIGTNLFFPQYEIDTLLYDPPGNQSTIGFTSAQTNGTTTTIQNSITNASSITFSAGTVFVSGSSSIGYSTTKTVSQNFQESFTNQAGINQNANSKSAYNPTGSNAVNHYLDQFVLSLNTQVTVANDDYGNSIGYSLDLQPLTGGTTLPDIVQVPAIDMINGTIDPDVLNQQQLPNPGGGPTLYLPGLASICKNVIQSEYNNLACTKTDQCGCTASDFSEILSQDPLLRWDASTLTANPMPGYETPLDADTSDTNGNYPCLTPDSSLGCEYVIVPYVTGSTTPMSVQLNGSDVNTFQQSDSTVSSITFGEQKSVSESTSFSLGWGSPSPLTAKLTYTNTWTWTDGESSGSIDGSNNTQAVTLGTTTTNCEENNYVYEDTRYHTFVIQTPQNVPNCQ